jgi:hypothetical protein
MVGSAGAACVGERGERVALSIFTAFEDESRGWCRSCIGPGRSGKTWWPETDFSQTTMPGRMHSGVLCCAERVAVRLAHKSALTEGETEPEFLRSRGVEDWAGSGTRDPKRSAVAEATKRLWILE